MANILVVDDDEQVREVLSELLALDGHEVTLAIDGVDAIEKLERNTDLVVADLIMPRKTGTDMIKEIRGMYPDISIVVISGGGNLKGTLDGNALLESWLGVEYVVQKPFHGDEIRAVVNKMLADIR